MDVIVGSEHFDQSCDPVEWDWLAGCPCVPVVDGGGEIVELFDSVGGAGPFVDESCRSDRRLDLADGSRGGVHLIARRCSDRLNVVQPFVRSGEVPARSIGYSNRSAPVTALGSHDDAVRSPSPLLRRADFGGGRVETRAVSVEAPLGEGELPLGRGEA